MARIQLSVFIRAPMETVWALITDFGGQERWMEDVHSLDVIHEASEGAGTVIRVTSKLFGLPLLHDVMVITRWVAPEALEILHCGQFSGSGAFRLLPSAGGTTFIWEEEFRPPLGAFGELAVSTVVGPHLRSVWGKSMENVRRLAESQAQTGLTVTSPASTR